MRGSCLGCWRSCPTIGLRLLTAAVLAASIGCRDDAAQASGRATIHSVSVDGDTAFTLDSDDAEMASARRLARCTLHEFGRRFKSSPATQTELSLKSRFSDVNDTEYLWVDVIDIVGDTLFRGTVANDPAGVKHLKYGDTVAVRAADVADWFAIDRDTLVGGFTLRVYRRRLAPAERAHEDSVRGYTVTEDSDAYRRLTSRCAGRGP